MLFWNANPILVQLGPIAVHWYGALFAAGFLLGYQLMQRIYRQEGRPTEQLDKLLTYIFIGTVVALALMFSGWTYIMAKDDAAAAK